MVDKTMQKKKKRSFFAKLTGKKKEAPPPPPQASNRKAPDSPGGISRASLPREINASGAAAGGDVSVISHGTGIPPQTPNGKGGMGPSYLLPKLLGSDDESVTVYEDKDNFSSGSPPSLKPRPTATSKGGTKDAKKDHPKGNWFTRTKMFKNLIDWAFDVVDADGSGAVDKKELYSGLLLIHLKLATYMGPAACRPVSREYVEEIFAQMDDDGSGCLDKVEFEDVMVLLCSQVLSRVVIQWTMTLMIVPLVAQKLLDGIIFMNGVAMDFWSGMDELDPVRAYGDEVWTKFLTYTPSWLDDSGSFVYKILDKIPSSVWEMIPLTLLTCILGCLAVPYLILKIDDYFKAKAEKRAEIKGSAAAVKKKKVA